jgi:C4-dicarboxylate transporter DctM subunit
MVRSGYPKGLAAAVESASSSLGAIIPPSIPMVVFGSIAGVSIGALFVAGYVPGLLLALGILLVLRYSAIRRGVPVDTRSSLSEIFKSGKAAAAALFTPIIVMGGILGGIMTPTEAGAVGALYALLIAFFLYRELKLRDLPRVLSNTAVTTGVVMLVMTIANGFSWIMAFEGIPGLVASFLIAQFQQPWLLMLVIVALLLVVGTFIDTISALIILTPLLVPVAIAAGIDPLFLGVIVVVALTLGVCTPPVGVVLFVTSSIAKTTLEDTSRALLPFFLVLFGVTFLLALLPQVVLWLPRLVGLR